MGPALDVGNVSDVWASRCPAASNHTLLSTGALASASRASTKSTFFIFSFFAHRFPDVRILGRRRDPP
jgi:hypothetical protein